jgi:peptidoglycan-N-acetylglucosamine deacetylase
MNRREFLVAASASAVLMALGEQLIGRQGPPREIAITLDDPNTYSTPMLSPTSRDDRLRAHLRAHGDLKVALFVCGQRVDNPEGSRLLNRWSDAGHAICNHTYSHLNYGSAKVTPERFAQDARKNDKLIRGHRGYQKMFRYPFLKEGESVAKRDAFRQFLKQEGWRVGHVTVDASDWYINDRLTDRLKANPNADTRPYRDYLVTHILDRVSYYDALAKQVLGRQIKHTILLHHSLLNALYLGELLDSLEDNGWQVVDAMKAYDDPVFESAPQIVPAGESLVWALAKESGRFEGKLRYPGEDSEYERQGMDALGL